MKHVNCYDFGWGKNILDQLKYGAKSHLSTFDPPYRKIKAPLEGIFVHGIIRSIEVVMP